MGRLRLAGGGHTARRARPDGRISVFGPSFQPTCTLGALFKKWKLKWKLKWKWKCTLSGNGEPGFTPIVSPACNDPNIEVSDEPRDTIGVTIASPFPLYVHFHFHFSFHFFFHFSFHSTCTLGALSQNPNAHHS